MMINEKSSERKVAAVVLISEAHSPYLLNVNAQDMTH